MIDVFSAMQGILRDAGFTTSLTSVDRSSVVYFEDNAVVGFGCLFESPAELIAQWKPRETSLLMRSSGRLRAAGEKAWNVYSLFLCASAADSTQRREVCWIEEDLERTRKVAACGISNREELVRALLPVLPLQYQPVIRPEDATVRLERRIHSIAPRASSVALDDSVPLAEVVRLFGEKV